VQTSELVGVHDTGSSRFSASALGDAGSSSSPSALDEAGSSGGSCDESSAGVSASAAGVELERVASAGGWAPQAAKKIKQNTELFAQRTPRTMDLRARDRPSLNGRPPLSFSPIRSASKSALLFRHFLKV
jgi:hypothetical protein